MWKGKLRVPLEACPCVHGPPFAPFSRFTSFSQPSFLSFSTNPALLTEQRGWALKKRAVYLGGPSYCLGQAGNWEWCTVGTISTWLSNSMNNTAPLLALACACGEPSPLLSPSKHFSLFFSFFSLFPDPRATPLPGFLLLECACLPEADSETNTCRTGRRLCHPQPCLNCCTGDQWDRRVI